MSIDLPFSFNRIYKGAPAEGMVFSSTTDLNNYLASPVRYAGQIVSLVEGGVVTAYKLNATEDAWEELGSGGGTGSGLADWATATAYTTGDYVVESNKIYKALTDHTSTTFATDLANDDWVEISADSYETISSGVLTDGSGILSIASGTTIDIADGDGMINGKYVSWTGLTGITVINIASTTSTHFLISDTGTVVQQTTVPTQAQRRTHLYLGKAIHNDLATVTIVNNQQEVASNPANQLNDILRAFKIINFKGNKIRKGIGPLQIQKSSGQIISSGSNFENAGNSNPHIKAFGNQSTVTFRYRTQDGEATGNVTSIDPDTWDNLGSTDTVTGNDATIQRVYMFPAGAIRIQYGQVVYNNLTEAIQNINNVGFVLEDEIEENAILIGLIAIRAGTTNLSDTDYCRFYDASIFGEQSVGAGGASVSSLGDAYNNSPSQPQILLSDGLGGVQVADAATPITGNLLEVVNNAVSEQFFAVNTDGIVAKSYGFTQNATAKIDTTDLSNVVVTDSEGEHLFKKESGELYFTDFKNELPTDLFTEDGGATVVNNTTTPMVGIREMQLTQSGASIGDGAEIIVALPTAKADWIKGAIDFNILTKHNANDGDFSIVFEESDDNITYTSISTVAVSSATRETSLKATLKSSTQYVKIRAQIEVANDGNVLTIARVNVTDNALATTGDTGQTNSIALSGNNGENVTGGSFKVPFKGTGQGWDGDEYTVQYENSSVILTSGIRFVSAGNAVHNLYINGTLYRQYGTQISGLSRSGATIVIPSSDIDKGDLISVHVASQTGLLSDSSDHFLNIWERGETVQLPIGGSGSWQPDTKILASTTGTTGVKSSLSKANLTVGKRYLVLPSLQFEETSSTSGDHGYQARFVHDSATISSHYGRAVTASNFRGGYPNAFVFTATATSIDFEVTGLSLTTLLGDGTLGGSFIQYIELPDEDRGAIVTPKDLQYFYENQTHIGYWKGKKLYAKSFEVTTDTASGSVGSLPAGAMPVGYPQHNTSGTSFRIMQAIDPSSTTGVFINYTISTGDLVVGGSGYHIGAGTSFTVKYTLD